MRHPLPVLDRFDCLDHIEIPLPCEVPWDSMAGDARVRHCGQCRQNVYNIASMTRPEALRLMESSGGRVCVRIFRRPDGTVLTADCHERLRQARQRGVLVFLGVLLLVVWAQVSAQIAGLVGLRRALSIGGGVRGEVALAGAPVPTPVPAGEPIVTPVLGEPIAGGIAPPKRPDHKMGKPAPRDIRALAGRMKIR